MWAEIQWKELQSAGRKGIFCVWPLIFDACEFPSVWYVFKCVFKDKGEECVWDNKREEKQSLNAYAYIANIRWWKASHFCLLFKGWDEYLNMHRTGRLTYKESEWIIRAGTFVANFSRRRHATEEIKGRKRGMWRNWAGSRGFEITRISQTKGLTGNRIYGLKEKIGHSDGETSEALFQADPTCLGPLHLTTEMLNGLQQSLGLFAACFLFEVCGFKMKQHRSYSLIFKWQIFTAAI